MALFDILARHILSGAGEVRPGEAFGAAPQALPVARIPKPRLSLAPAASPAAAAAAYGAGDGASRSPLPEVTARLPTPRASVVPAPLTHQPPAQRPSPPRAHHRGRHQGDGRPAAPPVSRARPARPRPLLGLAHYLDRSRGR